jgi:hypothetical protein
VVIRRRQPSSQAQGGCANTRPHLHLHRQRPHLFLPLRNPGLPPYPQLPHVTTPSSSACSRARLNRRLRHNPSHPAVHRPRAAQPYLNGRAIPVRFPTTHTVFEEVHPLRAAARRTWPRRLAPRDNIRAGGVWLGSIRRTHPSIHLAPRPESRVVARSLSSRRGRPARSPSAYPSPFRGDREAASIREDQERTASRAVHKGLDCPSP